MSTIGNNVKKIRKYLKLSQSQLAAKVKQLTGRCSQQTIANIENGNIRESSLLPYIALVLNVKIDQLNPNIGKGKFPSQQKFQNTSPSTLNIHDQTDYKQENIIPFSLSCSNLKLEEKIPVFGTINFINDDFMLTDTPIEYINRPHVVLFEKDTFGISISKHNTEPVFKIGDIVILHPRKIAKKGDLCLFLKRENNVNIYTIGELIKDEPTFWLIKYFTPEKERILCKKTWQQYFTIVVRFL